MSKGVINATIGIFCPFVNILKIKNILNSSSNYHLSILCDISDVMMCIMFVTF